MDSRSDSLAAKLQRADLLDEYFAWWLAERPSIAARKEWLEKVQMPHSNDAIHNLHRSSEAAMWRNAAAAKARAAMDANLPKNIDSLIRKSLLDQRFNAVMGELSHKELMDQFVLEADSERLRQGREKLALENRKVELAERRVVLLEDNAAKAKAALEGLKTKGGLTAETLATIEQAAGLL
jgi:hypothetical protein